jgi:hypothetical protein
MRAEIAAAERTATVRRAARAWRRSGWIGADAASAIAEAYRDDRQRMVWPMRALLFGLTLFGIASASAAVVPFLAIAELPLGFHVACAFVAGLACVAFAEFATIHWRMRGVGVESALAWSGLGFLLASWGWLITEPLGLDGQAALLAILAAIAIAFSVGAWRWGSWPMALVAGLAILGIFAGFPGGRLGWILFGGALAAVGLPASERASWPPPHRAVAKAATSLAFAAIAVALFPASNAERLVETLGLRREASSPIPEGVAWIACGVFALAVVVFAIRTRRRALLNGGVLLLAALTSQLAHDLAWGPRWALACGAGALLVGLALALRRFLTTGEGTERGGFTSEALLENEASRGLVEAAVVVATASPAARDLPPATEGLRGRGGDFGGGGSSGTF